MEEKKKDSRQEEEKLIAIGCSNSLADGKRIRGMKLSVFPSFAANGLDAFHRQRGKKCLAEESRRRGGEERKGEERRSRLKRVREREKKAEESGEHSLDAALEGR